jgi:hypothetical protein
MRIEWRTGGHCYKRGLWYEWRTGSPLRFAYVGRNLILNRNYFY